MICTNCQTPNEEHFKFCRECGRRLTLPRGGLLRYREWCGAKAGQPNKGLERTAEQVAGGWTEETGERVAGIVARDGGDEIAYSVADPAIFRRESGPSIAHATSAGKVMLAFSGRELPDGPLRAYTPRTITDPQELAAEIADVRERGYASAVGEREPDLTAVAAPIRGSRGELEAIVALQGPSARFDEQAREQALPVLVSHAEAISRELGWSPG